MLAYTIPTFHLTVVYNPICIGQNITRTKYYVVVYYALGHNIMGQDRICRYWYSKLSLGQLITGMEYRVTPACVAPETYACDSNF